MCVCWEGAGRPPAGRVGGSQGRESGSEGARGSIAFNAIPVGGAHTSWPMRTCAGPDPQQSRCGVLVAGFRRPRVCKRTPVRGRDCGRPSLLCGRASAGPACARAYRCPCRHLCACVPVCLRRLTWNAPCLATGVYAVISIGLVGIGGSERGHSASNLAPISAQAVAADVVSARSTHTVAQYRGMDTGTKVCSILLPNTTVQDRESSEGLF